MLLLSETRLINSGIFAHTPSSAGVISKHRLITINGDRKFERFSRRYNLVVVRFFVAAGGFLLIVALFTYLMKRLKDRYEWLHVSYRAAIGLVATRMDGFVTSPRVVPMMMMLFSCSCCWINLPSQHSNTLTENSSIANGRTDRTRVTKRRRVTARFDVDFCIIGHLIL